VGGGDLEEAAQRGVREVLGGDLRVPEEPAGAFEQVFGAVVEAEVLTWSLWTAM
jgi:hypothetical protein